MLAANHNSNFDPWPLGLPPWPRRQLYFMGKVELFNPVVGPLLRAAGAFPVRRGEADAEAIETAVRICKEGGIVAMFPEGTRRAKGLRRSSSTGRGPARRGSRSRQTSRSSRRRSRAPTGWLGSAQLKVAYGDADPVADLERTTTARGPAGRRPNG